MKIIRHISPLFLAMLALVCCVESYEPGIITEANSFLVVEGFLNSGNDSSKINLSRTVQLANAGGAIPESEARVGIESESGSATYQLKEIGGGKYVLEPVELNPEDRYRLKIQTRDGKEYQSDYVEVKVTPPIDSISWKYGGDGVSIYANTHDSDDKSGYYRWEYEETWEYHPPFISYLEYDKEKGEMSKRQEPTADTCWSYSKSTHIIIGSSAKLSADIISEQLLTFIPRADIRLSFKYSILVKQYVLSKGAFEYYQQMKKNSEEMGSFFDPQPMELEGNIRSTRSPDEPVLGFFSIESLQEKRAWINYYDVSRPLWGYSWGICTFPGPDTIVRSGWYDSFVKGPLIPLDSFPCIPRGPCPLNRVFATTSLCVDCRSNDSAVKPSFWD